jgi:hypothetical protein
VEHKQTGNEQRPSGTEEGFIGRQGPQWTVALEEEEVVLVVVMKKKKST